MDDPSKLSDTELEARFQAKQRQPAKDPTKLSDSELESAYEKVKAGDRSFWEQVKDKYKSLDVGVASGVAGLAASPRTFSDWGQQYKKIINDAMEQATGRPPPVPLADQGQPLAMQWPSQEDFLANIQKGLYGGAKPYEPKDPVEQGLKTTGEFAIGALRPGGPVARTAGVVVPATTSEFGGKVFEGTPYEGAGRLGGAIIGGAVQGGAEAALTRPKSGRDIIARHLPEDTTVAHINAAGALMDSGATMGPNGLRTSWPEVLSQVQQKPVLSDLMRHIEASPQSSARIAQFYGDRPQRVQGAVEEQAQAISPGPPTDPYLLGEQTHEAAAGVLNKQRQDINTQADPYYAAAAYQEVPPHEMTRLRALPGWDTAANYVRTNDQKAANVAGLPDSSLAFINAVKKEMTRRGENTSSAFRQEGRDVEEAGGWNTDAAAVRQAGITASRNATPGYPGVPAPYEEALRIETDLRRRYLAPLERGPLGRIADANPDIEKSLEILFPADPKKIHGEAAVGQAVDRIARISPKIAQDVVRAHIESVFDRAAQPLQTGPNQAGGAKFYKEIAGTGQQWRNLKAAVEALPNGQELFAGFDRMLQVMEAQGTRKNVGSQTAYNAELNKTMSPTGLVADTARVAGDPLGGAKPFLKRYDDWKIGKNLDEAGRLLIDPASINLLRQIARSRPGSFKEANMIRALAYSQAHGRAAPTGEANQETISP